MKRCDTSCRSTSTFAQIVAPPGKCNDEIDPASQDVSMGAFVFATSSHWGIGFYILQEHRRNDSSGS